MSKRVLFINSNMAHPIIPKILSGEGYRVDAVHDFEVGLQRLCMQTYDIIIVRESPGAESWPLCKKIRAITTTPLIVINSNASTENCVRAIEAGADFFIRKPFGASELLARVHCLLQRNSLYQPVSTGP
jgi:two-component system OmpR family response regulator